MRANQIWGLMALLALSFTPACHGGDTDTGSDTNETGDTDTDTNPQEFAPVTVDVFRFGVLTGDTVVNLDGPGQEDYTLLSGETVKVHAPGEYTAEAGEDVSGFDYPVDEDESGDHWATPPGLFSVQINVPAPVRLDEHKVFMSGTYRIEYEQWHYSASAPDHKGDYDDHYDLPDQYIEVDQDGRVYVTGVNPSMDVNGDADDYLQVVGDHFVLNLVEDPSSWDNVITASEIHDEFFSETTESAAFGFVAEVTCTKR